MINTELIVLSAQALVDQRSDVDIYMDHFMSVQDIDQSDRKLYKHEDLDTFICNTATCWAGALPFLDIGTDELKPIESDWQGNGTLNFSKYSSRVLSIDDDTVWDFLFHCGWPNSTKACLERAEFLHHHRDLSIEALHIELGEYAAVRGLVIVL